MNAKLLSLGFARTFLLLLTALAMSRPSLAQSYIFTDFPEFPGAIAGSTAPLGINDLGQIVGQYVDANSHQHGFLLSQGQFSTIDIPNSLFTTAFGINNASQVVGQYVLNGSSGKAVGFVGSSSISVSGAATSVFGINNSGEIVGGYVDPVTNASLGFLQAGGVTTVLRAPTSNVDQANGVNDTGQVVGWSIDNTGNRGFIYANGSFTFIDFPGARGTGNGTIAWGISNAGAIVGEAFPNSFIFANGQFKTVNAPGASATHAHGINNAGVIVGNYRDASGSFHGFMATPLSLVDPVPDLLSGSVVSTAPNLLSAKGRLVQGVAADGTTEVVVRIPTINTGDQFTLTIMNDQQPSTQSISVAEDGALGMPGATSFTQHQITVTAQSTGTAIPEAFAVYLAPVDFARPVGSGLYKSGNCGGTNVSDDQSGCRTVSIQIQNQTTGTTTTLPVRVLRPPVALIHGLWGNAANWSKFAPSLGQPTLQNDPRFHAETVDYDGPPTLVTIVSSVPDYSSLPAPLGAKILADALENSLGFQYNAPGVMAKIDSLVDDFKSGQNPAGVAAAAVQADIVAHSMGGDITRTLPLQFTFLSDPHLGQGNVHKVITIDTPHLGSPLANNMLMSQNSCVRNMFASGGMPSFQSVQVVTSMGPAAFTVLGAVGDLAPTSQALININTTGQGPRPLPTALIAGVVNSTNLAGLANTSSLGFAIHTGCGTFASNPLAVNLTPTGWPTVFGEDNDAIVGRSSQLANLSPDPGQLFADDGSGRGFLHTPGVEPLGFSGPTVIDPGLVPSQVITLLNTPVSNQVFHLLNP